MLAFSLSNAFASVNLILPPKLIDSSPNPQFNGLTPLPVFPSNYV